MRDALLVSLLSVLPRNEGSRLVGWVARSPASRAVTRLFVRLYGVDLSEAEGAPEDYPTLEALFTRRLRPGLRPIADQPDALVSPVDGTCAFAGPTRHGRFDVAPRRTVALSGLLGEDVQGERDVIVLYLSPRDYHRVHVPREGVVRRWRYLPGSLWPVFPAAVRRVRDLFARNERVVLDVESDRGGLQVVLVGAFGVGRIALAGSDLATNADRRPREERLERALVRGEELATFHLGSTVVLVCDPGRWRTLVRAGDPVRVGQTLATGVPLLEDRLG